MGHQIRAGEKEIAWSDGSQLVCGWCDPYHEDLRPWDQQMGSTYIPADVVKTANNVIPLSYIEAYQNGEVFVSKRKAVTEDKFKQCRSFLSYAAKHKLPIEGSY